MVLNSFSKILFDLLEDIELSSSKLYATFSRKFPKDASFWTRMTEEEEVHLKWVQNLRLEVEKGKVQFHENILRLEDLKKTTKLIRDHQAKAKEKNFDHGDALRAAAEIESSTLEQPFSRVFFSKNPILQKVIDRFDQENQKHATDLNNRVKNLSTRTPKNIQTPRNR